MLNPNPFSPLVNTTSSVVSCHIAVVFKGSNDFDIRLLCSIKLLVLVDLTLVCLLLSSIVPLILTSLFEVTFTGTPFSLCMETDVVELPVTMGKRSTAEIADVPEIVDVFVDKMEGQGTDVKACDEITVA